MAARDTIIEVEDRRTHYRVRIKVPFDVIQLAIRSETIPSGLPTERVVKARGMVCIQAKARMVERGRHSGWLDWEDIAESVMIAVHLPPVPRTPKRPASSPAKSAPNPSSESINQQGTLFSP